jgi:hydrogenase large subunit
MTRIHEPISVELEVNNGEVTDAWVSSTLFRGFELMLENRDPRDTALYSQRICGICSTTHAVASTLALEDAYKVNPTPNGLRIRNFIKAADLIQNHLRQFYVLALPDYARGPDTSPFRPLLPGDYKIPKTEEKQMYENYWEGIKLSAKAHQMLAIWGAKAPHQQTILPGGVTEKPTAPKINMSLSILKDIEKFVEEKYISDVMTICKYYPEYYQIGKGYGNLLSFGLFPLEKDRPPLFKSGLVENFSHEIKPIDPTLITEEVTYSWYKEPTSSGHPYTENTIPDQEKPGAYSWIKTPRYQDKPFEGGPLARLWINNIYNSGISVNDRNVARALEIKEIIKEMYIWLEELNLHQPSLNRYQPIPDTQGTGLIDSMRGPLGHWVKIKNGRTSHYQVVTPSSWNFAPRDKNNQRGPVEEALIGTPVADLNSLIEVGRVIRSFDPCFSCAVHVAKGDRSLGKYLI